MRKLSDIGPQAFTSAINEFNMIGRTTFLKKYGFSRSSKYYFLFQDRLYDIKALVAAAFFHQFKKKRPAYSFCGGRQCTSQIKRITSLNKSFRSGKIIVDINGELSNLRTDYDKIPDTNDLSRLGFSKWIPLNSSSRLLLKHFPGVYVVCQSNRKPATHKLDPNIVYIGESVDQNFSKRLRQFRTSLKGGDGHSGAWTLHKKGGFQRSQLWISIRCFPLPFIIDLQPKQAKQIRAATIRFLERQLLYDYTLRFNRYPVGNSK